MRVHLIKEQTIKDYYIQNPQSRAPLEAFLFKIKGANWEIPEDIKRTFGSADLLGKGSRRVVFNIGGNNYRMICQYKFGKNRVHLAVKWIGTHAGYDKLCSPKKKGSQDDDQYTINKYLLMETLKYTVIKTRQQYDEYSRIAEDLIAVDNLNSSQEEELDLLTVLIEDWDAKNAIKDLDPIQLLKSLAKDHNLGSKELIDLFGISKSHLSEILNYKRGLSKEVIRKLAEHFKLRQEAFNRPYSLKIRQAKAIKLSNRNTKDETGYKRRRTTTNKKSSRARRKRSVNR